LLGAATGAGASMAILFALNQGFADLWPEPDAVPVPGSLGNLAIAVLVVPLIATPGAGPLTRSRLPVERRLWHTHFAYRTNGTCGGIFVQFEMVAEAYRDLEAATGRLQLIERLAMLLTQTPTDVLPTIAYLCQGQIAPDFAGVDIGLAEKLATRALAEAAGTPIDSVLAVLRETGDLGEAAQRLLATSAAAPSAPAGHGTAASRRRVGLQVREVVDTLHTIAAASGTGSQARKLTLLADLLRRATPLEARYLLRLVLGILRLGIGTPTILDALAQVYAGGRAARPVLERAYNICCDLGLVAATLVDGGLTAVAEMHVGPGNPIRAMLAQRLSDTADILDKLGGCCSAEYKYDGMRIQAHRTADGRLELFTRRLERVTDQFPDLVRLLDKGLRPGEAILEGEVVAADPVSGELRPFQEVMFRRRKHGIAEAARDVPVSLFCFDLLYADGEDLTTTPYRQRRARLSGAIVKSGQLQLSTATEVCDAPALEAAFQQAVAEGCEGLVCKSLSPSADYQAGARGWQWIKLKRDYRTELSDTLDLVVVGALFGRGRRRGQYGALLLSTYDPDSDTFPTLCKCGTGFSDADLARLPDRLAPLVHPGPPPRVDARLAADVWFEPGMMIEVLGAELTPSPNHTTGWAQLRDDTGLALRFPRFTGRYRDDKRPEDATTVAEVVQLYRSARRRPVPG
jgi:DNA ligase 1